MSAKKKKASRAKPSGRSFEQRIDDLKAKIKDLEHKKAARELTRHPVYRHLRAVQAALEKAMQHMDGRGSALDGEFVKASRQYLMLLERALDEAAGKKRRGRKPKTELGK